MTEAFIFAVYMTIGITLIRTAQRRQPHHKKLAAARNKWTPLTTLLGILLWPIFLLAAIAMIVVNARKG